MAFLSLECCLQLITPGWACTLTEDAVGAASAAFSSRGSVSGSLSAPLETLNQVETLDNPYTL